MIKIRKLIISVYKIGYCAKLYNYNKNSYSLSRQQVAFREKDRKFKGCGSLEGFLYQIYDRKLGVWGCDMAKKM